MLKAAVIIILVALLPYLTHMLLKKEYVVHTKGGIVISGASTGIGRHAAVQLAKQGYTVFAGVRKQADADNIKKEAAELGNIPLTAVILDVTNVGTIISTLAEVTDTLDKKKLPLVGLVNNAGISQAAVPVELTDMSKAKTEFDVNYFGTLSLTQHFLPLLRQSTGRVVNVGSVAGIVATPNAAIYSSTKFALNAFTDALRRELAVWGISVSLIEPAYVKTEIGGKAIGDNSPLKALTAEQLKLYQHTLANVEEKRVKNFENADTCQVTTDAIVHALIDPFPDTRYKVARVGAIPAPVLAKVVQILPDRLLDLYFQKAH